MKNEAVPTVGPNFIRHIIEEDQRTNKNQGKVMTRFPPEPNGYLHLGHSKSICLNFGLAREFGGKTNLRFDDTNPSTEDIEYVNAIKADIEWLGFEWAGVFHASDYFDALFDYAKQLIRMGKAYVCSLNAEQMREYRGSLTEPGRNSPDRERAADESLKLLERMQAGEFAEGAYTVRAKIDMASPNINLRDPAIYRIKKHHHWRAGDKWNIYPMYDYAHALSDMLEGITHSLCTLEFEDHRPLYDWVLDTLKTPCHPQQIEFAKLQFTYTLMSKRNLLRMVKDGMVDGWDDPRLPTLKAVRRRGFPAAALRDLCERVGITKKESVIDIGTLEFCVREELNKIAPRAMCVLKPIKVVIENYPEGQTETLEAPIHPHDARGTRKIPFGREIYIDADDFMETPPKGYFRMVPGGEVRLRYAYVIKCEKVVKDASGAVTELRCTYFPETKSGNPNDTRKVKGVIHWVPAKEAVPVELRLYDRLFNVENPAREEDFTKAMNPASLLVEKGALLEPNLAAELLKPESKFQFERVGYFCVDSRDSKPGALVFNRTVTLKDTWAKAVK